MGRFCQVPTLSPPTGFPSFLVGGTFYLVLIYWSTYRRVNQMDFEPSTEDLEAEDFRIDHLIRLTAHLPDHSLIALACTLQGATPAEIALVIGRGRIVTYRHIQHLQRLLARVVASGWLTIDEPHPDARVQALLVYWTPTRAARALGCTPRQIRHAAAKVPPTDPVYKILQTLKGIQIPDCRTKAQSR